MKKLPIILIAVVISAAITFALIELLFCETCKPQTKAHFFLIDITENTVNIPDPLSITENYKMEENIFNGAIYRLKKLSSIDYSQAHELRLNQTKPLLENESDRITEVNAFFSNITGTIELVQNTKTGTNHSSILQPVMNELELLKATTADQKILYVYSDLRENPASKEINLYDKTALEKLQVKPSLITEQIENYIEIPKDLKGIEIHFIYKTDLFENAQVFESMAMILKVLLEEQGAIVFIHSKFKE